MALPISYSFRNMVVRRTSTALTAFGIAFTVAVFTGVFALREGFQSVFQSRGSDTIGVFLRSGAASEGESGITREQAEILVKEAPPEVVRDATGAPIASAELFLAVYMGKVGGGTTNVPLRGIQPATLLIHEDDLEIEGQWFRPGTDEVVVGRSITDRIENCKIGDSIVINLTPFKVVGIFDHPGSYSSEIWGDSERMMRALDRTIYQRVIVRVVPGTDFEALNEKQEADERAPMAFQSESTYLAAQTGALGGVLYVLGAFLTIIMGSAAVLGATNTMVASVSARTHEIGVLLAVGYSRLSVFFAFVVEAALIGLVGGVVGILLVLPFHGYQTGAMNWSTFTDVTFAYRITPALAFTSIGLAVALAVIGGAIPAWRGASLRPVDALRSK